jgi:hypothetical protein
VTLFDRLPSRDDALKQLGTLSRTRVKPAGDVPTRDQKRMTGSDWKRIP